MNDTQNKNSAPVKKRTFDGNANAEPKRLRLIRSLKEIVCPCKPTQRDALNAFAHLDPEKVQRELRDVHSSLFEHVVKISATEHGPVVLEHVDKRWLPGGQAWGALFAEAFRQLILANVVVVNNATMSIILDRASPEDICKVIMTEVSAGRHDAMEKMIGALKSPGLDLSKEKHSLIAECITSAIINTMDTPGAIALVNGSLFNIGWDRPKADSGFFSGYWSWRRLRQTFMLMPTIQDATMYMPIGPFLESLVNQSKDQSFNGNWMQIVPVMGNEEFLPLRYMDVFDTIHDGDALCKLAATGNTKAVTAFVTNLRVVFPLYKYAHQAIVGATRQGSADMVRLLIDMYWPVPDEALINILGKVGESHKHIIWARLPHIAAGSAPEPRKRVMRGKYWFAASPHPDVYEDGRLASILLFKREFHDDIEATWAKYVLTGEYEGPPEGAKVLFGQRSELSTHEAFVKAVRNENTSALCIFQQSNFKTIDDQLRTPDSPILRAVVDMSASNRGCRIIDFFDRQWMQRHQTYAELFGSIFKAAAASKGKDLAHIMSIVWRRMTLRDICNSVTMTIAATDYDDTRNMIGAINHLGEVGAAVAYLEFARTITSYVLAPNSDDGAIAVVDSDLFKKNEARPSIDDALAGLRAQLVAKFNLVAADDIARFTQDVLQTRNLDHYIKYRTFYKYPRDANLLLSILEHPGIFAGGQGWADAMTQELGSKAWELNGLDLFDAIHEGNTLLCLAQGGNAAKVALALIATFRIVLPLYKHAHAAIVAAARHGDDALFDSLMWMYWPVPDEAITNLVADMGDSAPIYKQKLLALVHRVAEKKYSGPTNKYVSPWHEAREASTPANKHFAFTRYRPGTKDHDDGRRGSIARYKALFARNRDDAWDAFVNNGEILPVGIIRLGFPKRGNNPMLEVFIKAVRTNNVAALRPLKSTMRRVIQKQLLIPKSVVFKNVARQATRAHGPNVYRELFELWPRVFYDQLCSEALRLSIACSTYVTMYPILKPHMHPSSIETIIKGELRKGSRGKPFIGYLGTFADAADPLSGPASHLEYARCLTRSVKELHITSPGLLELVKSILAETRFPTIATELGTLRNQLDLIICDNKGKVVE